MAKWIVLLCVVLVGAGASFAYVRKQRARAEAVARLAEEDARRIAELHRRDEAEAATRAEIETSRRAESKPKASILERRKADPKFDAAEKLLEDGDLAGADAAFKKMWAASPSDALALSQQGYAEELGGNPAQANEVYARALGIDPRCGDAHANHAVLNFDRATDAGSREVDLALELDPTCLRALQWRASERLLGGEIEGGLADFAAVQKLATRNAKGGLRLDENGTSAFSTRGTMYVIAGKDLDKAANVFEEVIKAAPGDFFGYWNRGHLLYDEGSFKAAAADFKTVCNLEKSDGLYKDDAQLYLWAARARLGETEQATRDLAAFVGEREPLLPPTAWRPKLARHLSGSLSATALFEAAESSDPAAALSQRGEAYFYAGTKKIIEGDLATAKKYLETGIATKHTNCFEYRSAKAELARLASK